ncbi:FkbM family methyltransferase [Muricoccus vinaceus]|uniref:FkbM family methyltransferase n=1 Tax=Muricoccus vinaceus TaxID=424704 RepID=A0ABV6ISZ4_9PROT
MAQAQTRYGLMRLPDFEGDMVSRFLHQYGEWAFEEARFIARNVQPGVHLLDIGAYVGTFGLGVALEQSLGKISFVEANLKVIPALQANIDANCNIPSTVTQAVVTSSKDLPRIAHFQEGNLSSMSFIQQDGVKAEIDTPRVISLAELRTELGDFGVIKIDAEGMELDILRSDPDGLCQPGVIFWLECNERPESLELAKAVLDEGFAVYYFAFPSFSDKNFKKNLDPIFPFAFEAGLFCTRGSAPTLDDQMRANGCMLAKVERVEDLRRAMWNTPRWGFREWLGLPLEQVVARAARAIHGETYETFLLDEAGGPAPYPEEREESPLWLRRMESMIGSLAERETAQLAELRRWADESAARAQAAEASTAAALREIARLEEEVERLTDERNLATKVELDLNGQVTHLRRITDSANVRFQQAQAALVRTSALADGRQVLLEAAYATEARLREQLNALAEQKDEPSGTSETRNSGGACESGMA